MTTTPSTPDERDLLLDRLRHCVTYLTEARRALNDALRLLESPPAATDDE
jgi:hypothetical protein